MLRRDRNAKAGQLKSMRLDRIWPEHCLLCPKSRVSWYGYNSRAFRNQHVRFTPESGHVQCTRLCPLGAVQLWPQIAM